MYVPQTEGLSGLPWNRYEEVVVWVMAAQDVQKEFREGKDRKSSDSDSLSDATVVLY